MCYFSEDSLYTSKVSGVTIFMEDKYLFQFSAEVGIKTVYVHLLENIFHILGRMS